MFELLMRFLYMIDCHETSIGRSVLYGVDRDGLRIDSVVKTLAFREA
jgi:hypothetical protein